MAEVAACPKCKRQLMLPDERPAGAQLRCPECQELFAPEDAAPMALAQAVVVEAPEPEPAPAPEPAPPEPQAPPALASKQPSSSEAQTVDLESLLGGGVSLGGLGMELDAPASASLDSADLDSASLDRADSDRANADSAESEEAEPAAQQASTDMPPEPAPTGTLSDWLQRGETPAAPEPTQSPPAESKAPEPAPAADAAEEPEAAEKRTGAKTVTGSPFPTQPSLESLLSSFRGDAQPTDARPPAAEPPAPSRDRVTRADQPPEPAAQPVGAAAPVTREPSPAVGEGPDERPTKFEDLRLDSLAPTAPANPPKGPAARPDVPAAKPAATPPAAKQPIADWRQEGSQPTPGRWRNASVIGASSLLGVLVGYLGLLWLTGPSGDVLHLSGVIPGAVLPASFSAEPEEPNRFDVQQPLAGETPAPPQEDPNIAPAAFESGVDSVADRAPQPQPQSPLAPAVDKVRLIGAPQPYPLAQLRDVMQGADLARGVMCDNSLAANPEAARDLGSAYGKLCQVAQVLTFLEEDAGDQDLAALEAKELFIRLFQFGHARADSRAMASRWLAWGERASGGVFFAGTLISAEQFGLVYEYRVKLSDGEQVAVLTDKAIRATRFVNADQMGVVGCVVEQPASRIEGYTGSAERAVWACHTIALGEPRFD